MTNVFLGQITMFGGNYNPRGFAFCNGQTLPIAQNQALFALLGTTYGGNGQTTFALPNLQGRVPMHEGSGFTIGQKGGEETHTINQQEFPTHNHFVNVVNANASVGPAGNYFAAANNAYHQAPANTNLAPSSITNTGGSQPHENRQPYLAITFAIALQGIFPSQT